MTHPAYPFGNVKLGRLPKKTDPRTLQLGRYIEDALPAPPSAMPTIRVPSWPMYGNDRLGDCTIAATGHMIQGWSFSVGKEKTLSESVIEAAYWETGAPPSSHGTAGGDTDNGRNELDVLNYWRKTGIGGDRITAYAEAKIAQREIEQGTYLFGGLYTGVALPLTAQQQHVWDVVPNSGEAGEPGSWGGHAVPFVGYDTGGVYLVTWGGVLKATWAFVEKYFEEAYAIVSPDWFGAKGVDVHGFNAAQLSADLKSL